MKNAGRAEAASDSACCTVTRTSGWMADREGIKKVTHQEVTQRQVRQHSSTKHLQYPPCQAPSQARALCVLFVLLRVSVGLSVGVCCTPADGRQRALPAITPPWGLCGSRRHRQNKSLAAEQPICQHLLSNPSPDIILTKFLLTPPASGILPAWLASVWSPQHFPHPHRKHLLL